MPDKPYRPCPTPGCPGLWDGEKCTRCDRKPTARNSRLRGSRHERGYGNDWDRLRDRYIKEHPLCEMCEATGYTILAEQVHHKIPFRGLKDPLRLDWDNLMSVCEDCHKGVTPAGG